MPSSLIDRQHRTSHIAHRTQSTHSTYDINKSTSTSASAKLYSRDTERYFFSSSISNFNLKQPYLSNELESNSMASRHTLRVTYLMMALFSFIHSPALGFACPYGRQNASFSHRVAATFPRVRVGTTLPFSSHPMFISTPSTEPRADFLYKCLISPFILLTPSVAHAFDGGVGGLGTERSDIEHSLPYRPITTIQTIKCRLYLFVLFQEKLDHRLEWYSVILQKPLQF